MKLFKEKPRERFLSPEELLRVNDALLAEPEPWRSYFPLVLLTGTRRMELLTAKWENIDLTARTLKLTETKNDRTLLLPLPAAAVAILRRYRAAAPASGFSRATARPAMLPNRKRPGTVSASALGLADVRIHDLRRTLGSWLAGAGFSLPMIGRALGHQSPSSTAIYARLDLDPVRVMLESNAEAMLRSKRTARRKRVKRSSHVARRRQRNKCSLGYTLNLACRDNSVRRSLGSAGVPPLARR